jgi:hypothetical protein
VHIKSLTVAQRELPPIRINYEAMKAALLAEIGHPDAPEILADTAVKSTEIPADDGEQVKQDDDDNVSFTSAAISSDWHPFYDSKGILYYYNFGTKEKMRRSPVAIEKKEEEYEEHEALKKAEEIMRKNAETFPNMSKRPGRADHQVQSGTGFYPPHRPRLQQSLHEKLITAINRTNK